MDIVFDRTVGVLNPLNSPSQGDFDTTKIFIRRTHTC